MKGEIYIANLNTSGIARRVPAIYMIVNEEYRALYLGQTFAGYGPLSRFNQHLSAFGGNTFIKRLCRVHSYDDLVLEEISFYCVPLLKCKEFLSEAREYREGVEYLVQKKIINHVAENNFGFGVISRVDSSPYVREKVVLDESKRIYNCLQLVISNVHKRTSMENFDSSVENH